MQVAERIMMLVRVVENDIERAMRVLKKKRDKENIASALRLKAIPKQSERRQAKDLLAQKRRRKRDSLLKRANG